MFGFIKRFFRIKKLKKSLALTQVHPDILDAIVKIMDDMKQKGYTVLPFESYRSMERQAELYAQGRTKPGKKITWARPGTSWHNYGLAVDMVFKDNKNRWSWDESMPWAELGRCGEKYGLKWGGRWTKKMDRPHFQLNKKMTIKRARELYAKGGLLAVWKEIDNG